MDVRLSAEQRALQEAAGRLADRLGPRTVAQIGDPDRVARLEAALAAAGWRELRVAVDGPTGPGGPRGETGAPVASAVEVAVVAEELGRRSVDVAYLGPTLAAELRRRAGVAPSGSLETVALTAGLGEPAVAVDGVLVSDAVALDTRGSSTALVLTPGPGGSGLAEVRLPEEQATVDLTRPVVALARETKAHPLMVGPGPGGRGRAEDALIAGDALAGWTALGLSTACADLVGTMRGALDLARDYARDRRQYGAPIGSFQAVQHLLADALVATEGSRSVARHAAWAVDARPPGEALAAAAVAKAYCARAARSVCETAIQVHGGIGNTWECLAHVHLRRALLSADVLGGEGPSLERVLAHHGLGGGDGLR
jgi:alkylation response protein AidB-like acyl-CoA dehydrogenase